MEELKNIIKYNTNMICIGSDLNELMLTKKQKQRIEEITEDMLLKFKKMSYSKIDYLVIGNSKKYIIVDIVIFTKTKAISFAVEFKGKEYNIKYTLISDKNKEFQENFNVKGVSSIYKRFLTSKKIFIFLLEKTFVEEKIRHEISYFMIKELKNDFEITNLYSDEKIKISKEFKDKMLNEIKLLQVD